MAAYWLIKSEPNVYSIADLQRDRTTIWDGVRNYQARNFLRAMAVGDRAFFYHSNAKPPGIAGLAQICRTGLTDPSQFDPTSPYFDPKSPPNQPRWQTVEIEFLEQFGQLIPIDRLKQTFSADDLLILRTGNRLSVTPIEPAIGDRLLTLCRNPD